MKSIRVRSLCAFFYFAWTFLTPPVSGRILAISGADPFDDQPFIDLIQQLASEEQALYLNERPAECTVAYTSPTTGESVVKGTGYTILLDPTGPLGAMVPDWPSARTRLEAEIANFHSYF